MKKLIMICITAAVMMAPLAAYARFRVGGVGMVQPVLGTLSIRLLQLRS